METANNTQTSNHSFWKVFLLALFLGLFGAHRFAVGKIKSGLLQLVTLGGLGIWALIDDLMILLGKFSDSKGFAIPNPNPRASWAAFVLAFIVGVANNSSDKKASVTSTGDNLSSDEKSSLSEPNPTVANAFKLGKYSHREGDRISSFTFDADLSCYNELNTDFGYVEKWGTWTLGENSVVVRWSKLQSQNVIGPKPVLGRDVEAVQSLEFGKDYVSVGSTLYYAKNTTPMPRELVERLKNSGSPSAGSRSQEDSKQPASTGKPVQQRSVAGTWVNGDAKILLGAGGSFMYQHPLRNFYGKWETSSGEYIKITFRDGTSTLSRYDADSDKLNHLGGTFRRQ